jgi:CubicO group peptidase (beta-lactamase class C family)
VVKNVEDSIARVLRDLRPTIPFSGRAGSSQSLATRMAHLCNPGVSIAVIDKFDNAVVRGIGVSTPGAATEVAPSTPFHAGSISKPVFALAVMRLVQDGILDLDANVNTYLQSWQVPDNEGWTPHVTLRQLLSHTAGTTLHGFMGYPANGPCPTVPQTLQGAAPANNPSVVVDMLPGLQFRYSGGGTTIAQQAIVDVLRKPLPSLMRDLVLDPLGLIDSTFEQPLPASMAMRAAIGHRWSGEQIPGGWHVYPEMAAAGLWTTAGDLARFGADLMRALRGEESALGLTQATASSMLQPQLPDQTMGQSFYGLGWRCAGRDNDFQFGHQGWSEGFCAEIRLFPALGAGAVVMINSNQGWPLLEEMFRAIGREYDWPAPRDFPTAIKETVTEDYAGIYRSQSGTRFRVACGTDSLILYVGQQPPLPLTAASETEFFATAANLRVQFERAAEGTVVCMTLSQGGSTIRLTPEVGYGLAESDQSSARA